MREPALEYRLAQKVYVYTIILLQMQLKLPTESVDRFHLVILLFKLKSSNARICDLQFSLNVKFRHPPTFFFF